MDILIPEEIAGPGLDELAKKYRITSEPGLWKVPAQFLASARHARALIIRNQTQVTAEIIKAAKNLVAIGRVGVGLDNIDMDAATRRGVVVVAPLDANATSVAELTLGLILALARKISKADRSTKAGNWDRRGCTGMELDGKVLTVCGFGRIGRLVAARARAFGLRVLVYDPFVKSDSLALHTAGAKLCSNLEEALAAGDFVTTHLPLNDDTRKMFNARRFAAMKAGAFFINTSRGGVVDEQALLEALKSGHLAGAALDVREKEPPATKLGFEKMDNVILTPHIGAATAEAQRRTLGAVVADIDRLLQGDAAVNFVNLPQPRKK
jgi:D-3-phosphoglycerate dehydrogenase